MADEGTVKIDFEYVAVSDLLCSTTWCRTLDSLGTFSAAGMYSKWLHEETPGLLAGHFYVETG